MKTLLAVLALALATGARAQRWEKLEEGLTSRITVTRVVTIRDAAQWRQVWSEHDGDGPAPEVDFERENVVAVFLGEQRTAAVSIHIVVQQDPLDSSRLNVFYREVVTKKAMSAQVISHPFVIIKVPRADVIDVEQDAPVRAPECPPAASSPAKRDHSKVKAYLERLEHPDFDGR